VLIVVGGGRMGEALVAGLLAAGWDASGLGIVEKVESRRKELSDRFPGVVVTSDVDGPCVAAVVAVKPNDVEEACRALGRQGVTRVLSIAAGVPLARLEEWLGSSNPTAPAVIRAMPNTPAQVREGAAAIAPGSNASDDDMDWAASILRAVGIVVRVPEKLLDAVTGLSGSGPAYVFLVAEALIDAGVLNGLPRDVAEALTRQTLLGAARLLAEPGASPEALRAAVTSPGGTTAAGLRALEHRAVRAALSEAVTAATERSRELGEQ
jgi:pyrroline-5-carboxylate reductase